MIRLPVRRRFALPAAAVVATASVMTVWLTEDTGEPARWRAGTTPSESLAPWPTTTPPSSPPGDRQPEASRSEESEDRPEAARSGVGRSGPSTNRPGPTRPSGAGPTRPTPAPPPPPPGASLDDLLENDGPPPPGVADQVNFFLGGGPDCPDVNAAKPRARVLPALVEIPDVPYVCLEGFDDLRAFTVTVTGPGTTRAVRATKPYLGVPWPVRPGMPTGRYHVLVTQGARNAATGFEVRRAVRPRLWVHPRLVRPGDPVEVLLGGFPRGRPADLHLYKTPGLVYRATTTVAVDARGEARLILRTSPTTELAHYALNNPLVHDPPPDADPAMPFGSDAVFLLSHAGEGP